MGRINRLPLNEESCSLSVSVSVEAKELKKCRSLVEANYATVKSDDCFTLKSNDSLRFHASSLPVEANNSKSVPFNLCRLIRPLNHVQLTLTCFPTVKMICHF